MTDNELEDNAAVLARMAERGDDLTQAREIEFAHLFEERRMAVAFCSWAQRQGYDATVEHREDANTDVIIRRTMVPELRALTELELTLAAAARAHRGEPDGWGCFTAPKRQS